MPVCIRQILFLKASLFPMVEGPTLVSYHDETRAFFQPSFPELLELRKSLVERLSARCSCSSIPLITSAEVYVLGEEVPK